MTDLAIDRPGFRYWLIMASEMTLDLVDFSVMTAKHGHGQ